MTTLEFTVTIHAEQKDVFEFHANFNNVVIVTPPHIKIRFEQIPEKLKVGSEISIAMRQLGIWIPWDVKIVEFKPYSKIVDMQMKRGPFKSWKHEHIFTAVDNTTILTDRISYELPFGILGRLIDSLFVQRLQKKIFNFRHIKTNKYFSAL